MSTETHQAPPQAPKPAPGAPAGPVVLTEKALKMVKITREQEGMDAACGLRIAVRPAHHRFLTGHAVRVRLSGGGSDRLTPPPEPVEVRIATGASTLRLPGFGR